MADVVARLREQIVRESDVGNKECCIWMTDARSILALLECAEGMARLLKNTEGSCIGIEWPLCNSMTFQECARAVLAKWEALRG